MSNTLFQIWRWLSHPQALRACSSLIFNPPSSPLASHTLARPHENYLCLINLRMLHGESFSINYLLFQVRIVSEMVARVTLNKSSNNDHGNSLSKHLKKFLLGILLGNRFLEKVFERDAKAFAQRYQIVNDSVHKCLLECPQASGHFPPIDGLTCRLRKEIPPCRR